MGLEDPGVSEGVAVVEHLLKMCAAEPGLVGHLTHIGFHVGSCAAQTKVQEVLFDISFYETERTFIVGVDGVVERNGIQLFFHVCHLFAFCVELSFILLHAQKKYHFFVTFIDRYSSLSPLQSLFLHCIMLWALGARKPNTCSIIITHEEGRKQNENDL